MSGSYGSPPCASEGDSRTLASRDSPVAPTPDLKSLRRVGSDSVVGADAAVVRDEAAALVEGNVQQGTGSHYTLCTSAVSRGWSTMHPCENKTLFGANLSSPPTRL